jgi:intergrase/recombinase
MIQKVREMINVLPPVMGEIVKFGVLVGLHPSEVVESVRLLQNSGASYYNPERQVLEHFRFPDIFLRRTKKAYISFITLDNLQPIVNLGCKTPGYNSIRLACQRRGIKCDMRYCRKLFASWLRLHGGVQPEVVDMLQGRVSPSVLTRHYLVPTEGLKDQVLNAVNSLCRQL